MLAWEPGCTVFRGQNIVFRIAVQISFTHLHFEFEFVLCIEVQD